MTTDQEYAQIANEAYLVDPLKQDPPLVAGQRFSVGKDQAKQFEVLDEVPPVSNPISGFQGVAVAPVVNGVPDTSQVVIAFAGTNPEDRGDLLADVESVVGGETGVGTQVAEARLFAAHVRAQYPGASVSVTGHSLGGTLALDVAAEFGWSGVTFNGPDPWGLLSPKAKKWLMDEAAAGRYPLKNFVNEWDVIGNFWGNGTGAALYVGDREGRDLMDYHNLDTAFAFGPDGAMLRAGGAGKSTAELIANALSGLPPETARTLGPILNGLVDFVRTPGVAGTASKMLSGLAVTVDTVAALSLAGSIGGLAAQLQAIRDVNDSLVDQMQVARTGARAAAYLYPFVTEADIEDCFDRHRLHVRQNIDVQAVEAVSADALSDIVLVTQLADGIARTVAHAAAQDAQWALVFGR